MSNRAPTGLDGNQVLQHAYIDDNQALAVVQVSQLIPEEYDSIELTYVTAGNGIGEIETVTYKQGGLGGTTIATLTLAYDGADNLISVVRS